ncbi:hypothetical protein KP509_20G013800 [Ceratopteris richardii]|uniref:C2H2-type domain-containing protein n=2 Tax=Ceratopteris richardii TaxID=49495 RepID=A0A8T2SD87_CERRI|nr:hypothetical protein KP509_20G013800 [Ceratopteris richardii]KAH7331060.1 hypothetical protein KP509_20G013800 [Ceratopteris richardii]KAH7331062.1 hypothetical protein KP509_20G013800 [Ceratopteris richardii]KAH7331064.1 hypothetical protein KP509_20G013800 [Ceratopteris richardii]
MKAREQEAVDDLLKNTPKIDLFPLFNKLDKSTFQLFNWFDILEQQSSNLGCGASNLDSDLDFKGTRQQESVKLELTGRSTISKDVLKPNLKSGNMFGRGLQTSGEKYSTVNFTEAMQAFAKAAKAGDLPSWQLMSNKTQMHKCEKCSLEFCSPFNLRRHMRAMHRRPLNGDKEDLRKKREQIAAFWDKLNMEDASEIVSAKNLSVMDLTATSIVRALSSQLQQQSSLLLLPQSYIKIATSLLDLVQNKNLKEPPKSEELFAILEDASEKNMLFGVTSSSMHRCVFDSDAERVGLESKNLAASLGFLVEYKLVRAWMDDKDAEALRCQKALVEEEEAAQKRQAMLLERKKQKKLRQKELKDKEKKSNQPGRLQDLKLEVFPREGEDSLTATQSSPSSIASSGLESHSTETAQMVNGDCEDLNSSTSCFEAGHAYGSSDDAGIANSEFCNHDGLQKVEMLNEAVEEAHAGSSAGFFLNGTGWKERRQTDATYSTCNGRQPYNKDRKYYDYQHGSQRLVRSSHGIGSECFTPKYGHYREKLPVSRRPTPVTGVSHAVWARKTPQSVSNSESLERNVVEGRDDLTGARLTGQSDQAEIDAQTYNAKSEKLLSRASSLSSDSSTSQSSVSISARVGAEEQDTLQTNLMPVSLAPDNLLIEGDFGGSTALVIGSVTIPLEHPFTASKSDGALNESYQHSDPKSGSKSAASDGHFSCLIPHSSEYPQVLYASSTSNVETVYQSSLHEDSNVLVRSHGSTMQSKSAVKVWRPVTPGEHGSPCSLEASAAGVEKSYETDSCPQAGQGGIDLRSCCQIEMDSSSCAADMDTVKKDQVILRTSTNTTVLSLSEDNQQLSEPTLGRYHLQLQTFLAQRWRRARSSPDIVYHKELDETKSVESF